MNIKNLIVETILEAAQHRDLEIITELNDDSVLLESGLDSLGYAIVVALLEDELGFDPFAEMDEPVYPSTLKEFTDIYLKHK